MKVFVKKINGLKLPERGTEKSAGYDIFAAQEPIIVGESIEIPMDGLKLYKSIDYLEYHTNLYVAPEKSGEYIEIYPRSSITKKNLILKNSCGIIDSDYRGQLILRMAYIIQPEDFVLVPEVGMNKWYVKINQDKIYHAGDKLAQLIARKSVPMKFESVKDLSETQRASGGFGSTGK